LGALVGAGLCRCCGVLVLWEYVALDVAVLCFEGFQRVMVKVLVYLRVFSCRPVRCRGAEAGGVCVRWGFWAAVLSVVVLALGGCGGSGNAAATAGAGSAGDPVSEPDAVVARVGTQVITKAVFAHALAGVEKFEGLVGDAPVPPDFTACVRHVEATSTAAAGARPGRAALRVECQGQYQGLMTRALDRLISDQWVIGGAAEAGVSVSAAELRAYLKREQNGRSQAQVARQLALYGRTLADAAVSSRVQLLSEGIRHLFAARTEHLSSAQVAGYYDAHRSEFGTPPRRAVEIARTASRAEALRVKREIASGRSFASVVKGLPVEQPIFSKDGFIPEYEPNLYREPPLNDAIFAARPGVLSGPVGIYLGYYIFEVKRTFAAVQEPLSAAQATIRAKLPNELYKRAFSAFVAGWRARWKAKTFCSPGFVTAKCAGAPGIAEDPFTLN
jgi:parvulin-like peptidyl-prolyl isomerase